MSLASVLPFLAQLKKSLPGDGFVGENNVPGSTASGAEAAWTPNGPPLPQPPDSPPNATVANQPPDTPTDMGSLNPATVPGQTKGHLLLRLLQGGLQGGLSGMAANAQTYAATGRSAGFGGGAAAGYTQQLPFQRAMQGLELQKGQLTNEQLIQMLPFLRAQNIAGLAKTSAEANKFQAEAGKATAETGAVATKQALEAAQTEAANYKDDPNLGLIDLRTKQPVAGNLGTAPLTDQEAAILGKQPGESVPLKIKNQANEMVNRGIRSVSAGGRQLLVDNQGNTIKDMGQATPMAVINAQMSGPPGGQLSPDMQAAASKVAQGKTDLATAIRPFMRFPGMAMAFQAEVYRQNPDYFQGNYEAARRVLDNATSGPIANEINAFNTAIAHAQLLRQAAKALNNGDQRTLAGLSNRAMSEFGDPALTNFDAINHVYQNEIQKMIAGNHITNQEIGTNAATLPSNANYATIDKVLGSYESLAKSKLQFRRQQVEQGMQGKPNFPAAGPPPGASHAVVVNGKTVGYTSDGKTMTPAQ